MPGAQMSFVCGSRSVPWDSVSRASHAIQQYRWGIERTFALLQAGYGYIDMDFPSECCSRSVDESSLCSRGRMHASQAALAFQRFENVGIRGTRYSLSRVSART